jgi:hypothetical protein
MKSSKIWLDLDFIKCLSFFLDLEIVNMFNALPPELQLLLSQAAVKETGQKSTRAGRQLDSSCATAGQQLDSS